MKKGILFLVLLAMVGVFVFSLEGCDHHHDPDPCLALEPVTAKFSVKEPIADTTFVTDTVFAGAPTIFEADQEYTSYLWRVGNDPRTWTTKVFSLTYNEALGNVPVTLIVQKLPNKTCFPKDNGIDNRDTEKACNPFAHGQLFREQLVFFVNDEIFANQGNGTFLGKRRKHSANRFAGGARHVGQLLLGGTIAYDSDHFARFGMDTNSAFFHEIDDGCGHAPVNGEHGQRTDLAVGLADTLGHFDQQGHGQVGMLFDGAEEMLTP